MAVHPRTVADPAVRGCAERLLGMVRPEPGEVVLEAPCGVLTGMLARRPGLLVVAAGDDAAELSSTRTAVTRSPSAVIVVCARAGALPARDSAFDVCVSLFTLGLCPDPAAALGEMLRALRRGTGRMACVVWGDRAAVPHLAALAHAMAAVSGRTVAAVESSLALGPPGVAEEVIAAAGLGPAVSVRRIRDVLRFDGIGHWWHVMVTAGSAAAELAALPPDQRAAVQARCAEILAPHTARDGTMRMAAEMVVFSSGPVAPA